MLLLRVSGLLFVSSLSLLFLVVRRDCLSARKSKAVGSALKQGKVGGSRISTDVISIPKRRFRDLNLLLNHNNHHLNQSAGRSAY